jgi:hypothetical protein
MKGRLFIAAIGAVLPLLSAAAKEFAPIDFPEFGYEEPSLEFVVGGDSVKKILDESNVLALLSFSKEGNELANGLSVRIQGRNIAIAKMIQKPRARTLLDSIRNPLNYGEGNGEYFSMRNPPEFPFAFETTNGDFFVRMYVDASLTFCNFYCQNGKTSTVWKLSPNLKELLSAELGKKEE